MAYQAHNPESEHSHPEPFWRPVAETRNCEKRYLFGLDRPIYVGTDCGRHAAIRAMRAL